MHKTAGKKRITIIQKKINTKEMKTKNMKKTASISKNLKAEGTERFFLTEAIRKGLKWIQDSSRREMEGRINRFNSYHGMMAVRGLA